MPMGSDQFYEFTAMSISSTGSFGVVEVETSASDWKYIKRMRKGRVLLKLGIMFQDDMKMVTSGFIESQRRDVLGCTCHFEFNVQQRLEQVE